MPTSVGEKASSEKQSISLLRVAKWDSIHACSDRAIHDQTWVIIVGLVHRPVRPINGRRACSGTESKELGEIASPLVRRGTQIRVSTCSALRFP